MHALTRPALTLPADVTEIDRALARLAGTVGALELELGRWLLAAEAAAVHRHFGFASLAEYVDRRLGLDARGLRERLRVARALAGLPRIRRALERGDRPWSAVRELTRVATPETERAWVDRSERLTVREVEALVAGRRPGDRPTDPRDPLITPRRVAFELAPEDLVVVQEALERARGEVGPGAPNGAALVVLAQAFLGARPSDAAGYRTTVTVCARCDRTWQPAGAELVEVPGEIGACARCDGEVEGVAAAVDDDDDRAAAADDARGTPSAMGREGLPAAPHGGRDVAAAPHGGRDGLPAAPPEDHAADILRPRESPHAQRDPAPEPASAWHATPDRARPRARQLLALAARVLGVPTLTLTPRLRAAVRARDHHRCAVPGCRNFRFVDLHHRHARAAGGVHALDNLISLCTAHHRAVHEGTLAIEGTPAEGLRFLHAGGVAYGAGWRG